MIALLVIFALGGLLWLALVLALLNINKARKARPVINRAPCYGGAPFFSNEECN